MRDAVAAATACAGSLCRYGDGDAVVRVDRFGCSPLRLACAAHARRAVWPLLRDASWHAAAATTLLRDAATWPDACAEAVAARRAARAATHHPEPVPLSQFGAQDAATVYGPLFFPLVTCVCGALWHEVQRARSAKRQNA